MAISLEEVGKCDVSPIIQLIKQLGTYKRWNVVERRLAPKVRFLLLFCLFQCKTIIEAYRRMCENEGWRLLGFRECPNYELLREFINERIGQDNLRKVFDTILYDFIFRCRKEGIEIGVRTGEDATDIYSLKHDKEAEYSPYYRHYGYKLDVVHDLNYESIPLSYRVMGINEYEGDNFIPAHKEIKEKFGCKTKEAKVDGKYATYRNIAWSFGQGIELKYEIQKGWKYNKKGTAKNVNRLYQKHWRDKHFVPNARMEYKLSFLLKAGEEEAVGAYVRNMRITEYEANPEKVAEEMGERTGKTEGFMSILKRETLIGELPRKRGRREIERMAHIAMIGLIARHWVRIQLGRWMYGGNT